MKKPLGVFGSRIFRERFNTNYIVLVCLTASFVIAGCAGEMRRGLPVDRQRTAKAESSRAGLDLESPIEIPRNVLFIHAAWLTPKSWDNFSSFFKAKGYVVSAPPWPGKKRVGRRAK